MNGDRKGFKLKCKTDSITHYIRRYAGWGLLISVFLLPSCAGSKKSNYYNLYPMNWLTPKYDFREMDVSIGIGPVILPEYLNRQQIVSRISRYEVNISEINRWAESLDDSVPRVVAENLSTLLSTDSVSVFPWVHNAPDYQVEIEIIQFEGSIPGNVAFLSRWSLFKRGQEMPILSKKFNSRKPIAGQGYEGMVSTMSLMLYDLSDHIAEVFADEFPFENAMSPNETP